MSAVIDEGSEMKDINSDSENAPSDNNTSDGPTAESRESETEIKIIDIKSLASEDLPEIVNGFLAVESLQQLSTNMLPSYIPPAVPSIFKNGNIAKVYSCNDCGDSFVSSLCFTFHIKRRSILIKFPCCSCSEPQTFYNRCSLMSHIREHTYKKEPSDIKKALVYPLPHALMGALQTDLLKKLEDEPVVATVEDSPVETKPSSEILVLDEVKNIKVPPRRPSVKIMKCSECPQEFENHQERREHFINGNKIPVMIALCCKCGILCPTECSLKAHKRLHLQISPYVCPECGDNPDRYWENFQKHLKFQCFHYSRSVGYKCDLCVHLFHSSDSLKKHFITDHTQTLVKCCQCPMAFVNSTGFNSHRKTLHGSKDIKYNLLYKCSFCDIVFISKDQISGHLATHIKDNTSRYTFNCMECQKPQESKLSLRNHLRKVHPKIYAQFSTYISAPEEIVVACSNKKNFGFNRTRIECMLCHCSFMSHQGYSVHCSKSHSNGKYPCGVCSSPAITRREMINHGKRHLRKGTALCLLCYNKFLTGSETLDIHLMYHVERVKFQTCCPICECPLYNFDEALQHLKVEHLLSGPIQSAGSKSITNATSFATNEEKSSSKESPIVGEIDEGLPATKSSLPQAATALKRVADEKIVNVTIMKRSRTDVNECSKCTFQCNDREEFKKHILDHKVSKTSYQCQECGMCFVVKPSLQKHLKILHKIVNVEQYIKEEGTNFSPEKSLTPDVTKINELECTVCFESFTTETLLKTHMRSHGMAFIRKVSGY